MKDLGLFVPSRERPENIGRLSQAMEATCRGDTWLTVGLDGDDPRLPEYLALQEKQGWDVVIKDGLRSVVPWINTLVMPAAGTYKYIGHIGDDNVPVTEGWDIEIMAALENAPFAFGNDLYPRTPGSLCCHVFTRSEVVQRLGYMGPPSIRHMYVDVAWMAWGLATRIIYLHDVIIDHRHYTVNKAPFDQSYALSQARIPSDLDAYHEYCRTQLNADIAKIDPEGRPYTPETLRQFNIGLNIPPVWGAPVG